MGTTSEKLVYLNDTKVLIRNKLNKFGAELNNENTFRSYATFLEDLYNDYPTVSDVGSNVTLNNTKKAPLKKLDLNSTELTQDGTPTPDNPVDVNVITGSNNINITNTRNLLDFNNITVGKLGTYGTVTVENNEIKFTATGQQVYGVQINLSGLNLKNNTTYTVSDLYNITTSQYVSGWRYYNGSSYTPLNNYREYFTFTTTESGVNQLLFYVGSPATLDGTLTLYNIQLLEGEILESDIPIYIPYSQKLEQNYHIDLRSDNLFNKNAGFMNGYIDNSGNLIVALNNALIKGYIKVKPNTTYIISQDISIYSIGICLYNETTFIERIPQILDTDHRTFTTNENTNQIRLFINLNNQTPMTQSIIDNLNIRLNEGNVIKPYTPYYNLDYCKIGDYADQIFKNTADSDFYDSTLLENEWYLKKNIGKIVLDGNESGWNLSTSYNSYSFWKPNNQFSFLNSRYKKYCNLFQYSSLAFDTAPNPSLCENTGTLNMILFKTNGDYGETVTEWKEWLSSHHVQVYCPLETSQYIHISETDYPILRSQLENLYNNAKSYNGQTNITQTNDDLPFNIELSALMKGE